MGEKHQNEPFVSSAYSRNGGTGRRDQDGRHDEERDLKDRRHHDPGSTSDAKEVTEMSEDEGAGQECRQGNTCEEDEGFDGAQGGDGEENRVSSFCASISALMQGVGWMLDLRFEANVWKSAYVVASRIPVANA